MSKENANDSMIRGPGRRWLWLLLLLSAPAVLTVEGCKRQAPGSGMMMGRPPAMVSTAVAVSGDVPVYLDEIGKTVAIEMVSIIPQVGGKIVASHVEDGAYVKKGELLFEIDPRPFEAALASTKATLAQNKAEWDLANTDFKRAQELIASNAATQYEFEQKRSGLGVAEAKVAAAQAAILTAQLNLEYTKIYSPINGRAGAVLVDPGNIVKANEATLLGIQQLDPIYAEFTVTENDLGTVRKFMAARGLEVGGESSLGLKCLVDVPGDSAQVMAALGKPTPATAPSTGPAKPQAGPRQGEVTFLDNTVQPGSGTVRVRATVANPDRYFWPGQFVKVRLVLTTKKNAVLIPAVAQQIGQQGAYVYVVQADHKAQLRPITPGQRQGDLLVVEQGVEAGERVVVTGQLSVTPNEPVIDTSQAPPAQASAGKSSNDQTRMTNQ